MLDFRLQTLLTPVISAMGYELLGIERLPQGRRGFLIRVYIDHSNGINLADCERVSYQISGVLDVENPIVGSFTLEVSSPGFDRPLYTIEHYRRFIGHKAKIRLSRPLETRRNFVGVIQSVEMPHIILQSEDGQSIQLPFDQIDKANLVAE